LSMGVDNIPKCGRPRKLTSTSQRHIVIKSKMHPKMTANDLRSDCNLRRKVSVDTVKRVLRRANLFGRIAVKKPFISKVNKKKRRMWCLEMRGWNVVDRNRVIFSDESKIELRPRRREYVRRSPNSSNSRMYQAMVTSTTKFSPSVMVWGAIRGDGRRVLCFCEESVDQLFYQRIFGDQLPSIYSPRYFFQQDGARAHTARSTTAYLVGKQIRLLENWPPQSPDLSPIEHMWDILKDKVASHNCSTLAKLRSVIKDEWAKISNDQVKKLFESMPRRIDAVLKARGGNTKY